MQRAYWLGRSNFFELGKVACHVYLEFDITNLDREQVQAAWRTLVERHEMLRAMIRDDGLQQILPDVPKYEIEHRNLRGVADAQQLVDAIRERMSHQVLPAGRWPLFELRTSRLDRQTLLHMSLDLLTIDFWSIQLLLDEWLRLSLDPGLRLAPLAVSFRDYVLAAASRRDSPGYRRAEEYWRQRLGTLAPPPKLPFARSPSAVTRQRFIRRQAVLDSALWQRLKNRSGGAGLTPSVTLMAAFARVLGAWSREADFTLTLTFFERMPSHPQVNQLVGDFTSILLFEVHVGAAESFEAMAKRMATRLWSDLEHGAYSGVQLLQEMAKQGTRPTVPVVFTSALGLNTSRIGCRRKPRGWAGQHHLQRKPDATGRARSPGL